MAGPPAAVKQFNKVAVGLAGHRLFPVWAVLRHRGRKKRPGVCDSGRRDSHRDHVHHRPAWGRGTDWVRNVRAAGGCTIRWRGVDYECTESTFVDKDRALAAARGMTRRGVHRRDFPGGLHPAQASGPALRRRKPLVPRWPGRC